MYFTSVLSHAQDVLKIFSISFIFISKTIISQTKGENVPTWITHHCGLSIEDQTGRSSWYLKCNSELTSCEFFTRIKFNSWETRLREGNRCSVILPKTLSRCMLLAHVRGDLELWPFKIFFLFPFSSVHISAFYHNVVSVFFFILGIPKCQGRLVQKEHMLLAPPYVWHMICRASWFWWCDGPEDKLQNTPQYTSKCQFFLDICPKITFDLSVTLTQKAQTSVVSVKWQQLDLSMSIRSTVTVCPKNCFWPFSDLDFFKSPKRAPKWIFLASVLSAK